MNLPITFYAEIVEPTITDGVPDPRRVVNIHAQVGAVQSDVIFSLFNKPGETVEQTAARCMELLFDDTEAFDRIKEVEVNFDRHGHGGPDYS